MPGSRPELLKTHDAGNGLGSGSLSQIDDVHDTGSMGFRWQ